MNLQNALAMTTLSDPGRVRSNNEDAVAVDAACGLAILADGMGGYRAGEVASGMAIDMLLRGITEAVRRPLHKLTAIAAGATEPWGWQMLRQQIALTNQAIHTKAQQPAYEGMGTTLVVALFHDNILTVAHIGDSRLYRWRAGVLEQVTRDHSLWQEFIASGLPPPKHMKNLVTRALGKEASAGEIIESQPEIHDHAVLPGDVYLLCSDGMHDMVSDHDMATPLELLSGNLPLAAARLIQMANENGGKDNVSVALIRVLRPFPARGIASRIKELIGV